MPALEIDADSVCVGGDSGAGALALPARPGEEVSEFDGTT
jgi:hypothetical protein